VNTLKLTGKEDVVKFVSDNNVKILNLCHIPEDGRLKTLSFSLTTKGKIQEILEYGERVDGSSLFSFIEPSKSDIYIAPRLETTFTDPFSQLPTLNILCDYLDEDGRPLNVSPRNVLLRAEEKLRSANKIVLKALTELEFYIMSKPTTETLFKGEPDKNYQESAPLANFEDLRNEAMATLAHLGIATKYGHSEVGRIIRKDGTLLEQQEIELAPQNLVDMAEAVAIAKWTIRNTCATHGVAVSFSPKVCMEHAGSGMHVHLCAIKDGKNTVANPDGTLSDEARKMIGGILKFAPSLSAFGNPKPVSYVRFVARKESPMHICWSVRDRLALIRIPLWWSFKKGKERIDADRETFEYRAPDAFANPYLLLAGIAVAVDYGLKNKEETLKLANRLHINEAKRERKPLKTLPQSCNESAQNLEKDRELYEAQGVFPRELIDKTIETLKSHRDKNLWQELINKPDKINDLLERYLHYG
jgi:glutamine synthetase